MELIGKANLRTLGLFQKHARSQAPFLDRHYPASTVLRACPPPQTAQPAPHGVLVESHDLSPLGLPVFRRSPPPRMPTPLPRRNHSDAIAISSGGYGLPQMPDGSASATLLFGDCSAFTHVSACAFARSPKVTFTQSTSTNSLPPSPLWLLPAERSIGRTGFAPAGDGRLFTAYRHSGVFSASSRLWGMQSLRLRRHVAQTGASCPVCRRHDK
jgi:hypothetical protein